ncbi:helical backbone metal receptor [Aquabacterium sp. A7-Y]|uniref:helical backbone metal receptor n=1 Tax=Aquabacterium sp. A7-Y TaxID=1349605 RepID=UPI00223E5099|nr:helical backbone metal receptor [Aquabacterium sp. A7-Y]MCW7538395.1 helical backbone metal receptor [Aquabacterium sp. A7-Y]
MSEVGTGPAQSPRIASLVPSATELLVALGLGPHLVARTGFCIHPREQVAGIPKVGGTKSVNLAKLRRLAPTHVVVNVDENEWPAVEALQEFVPHVVVTHPCSPEDNVALYRQLADTFGALPGVRHRAEALTQALQEQLALTGPADARPRRAVLYCVWREPWMTVARDTYISRLLALVNWQTLPAIEGGPRGAARYPTFDWSAAWLSEVDEVLLSSEPYRFDASHRDGVAALLAAAGHRAGVRMVDGELLSWWGSRAVDGVRYLRSLAADRRMNDVSLPP